MHRLSVRLNDCFTSIQELGLVESEISIIRCELVRRMPNIAQKREEVLYGGDNDGNTMLMDAIRDKNFELCCLLLEQYADPTQKNNFGQDSLAIAEECGFEELSFVIRDMQENGL
tara:strand:- start:6529 stop:6873 length:345 start_codon:yes stop_codon:yes gene_type:complete